MGLGGIWVTVWFGCPLYAGRGGGLVDCDGIKDCCGCLAVDGGKWDVGPRTL